MSPGIVKASTVDALVGLLARADGSSAFSFNVLRELNRPTARALFAATRNCDLETNIYCHLLAQLSDAPTQGEYREFIDAQAAEYFTRQLRPAKRSGSLVLHNLLFCLYRNLRQSAFADCACAGDFVDAFEAWGRYVVRLSPRLEEQYRLFTMIKAVVGAGDVAVDFFEHKSPNLDPVRPPLCFTRGDRFYPILYVPAGALSTDQARHLTFVELLFQLRSHGRALLLQSTANLQQKVERFAAALRLQP